MLENIQRDKLLHFLAGSLISFPLVLILDWYGLVLSLLIFLAKEFVWDKYLAKGNFEWMDFVWSAAPALMFYIIKIS